MNDFNEKNKVPASASLLGQVIKAKAELNLLRQRKAHAEEECKRRYDVDSDDYDSHEP